jgi:hypothetical protein
VRNAGKYLGEFLLALNPLQASNLGLAEKS